MGKAHKIKSQCIQNELHWKYLNNLVIFVAVVYRKNALHLFILKASIFSPHDKEQCPFAMEYF